MASLFTDKFFDSPLYKALQAPYNDRMARERAANNPLAPSQGGSWPDTRPRSTALTPQSYTPNIPPANPNDPNRATADMRVPGVTGPPTGGMAPFPLAYPGGKPPIDITVRGGNPTLAASIPLPRPRPGIDIQPWAPENMSENGNPIAAPPMASAYAPQATPNPAAAAATAAAGGAPGQPQTSWMQDMITGLNGLLPGAQQPRQQTPAQAYDAANFMASNAARNQDRSGIGTDGYVRNSLGVVIGRNANFQGMTPSQQYDFINGNFDPVAGVMQDDSWKTIGPSGSTNKQYRDFGFGSEREMVNAIEQYMGANGVDYGAARSAVMDPRRPKGGGTGGSGPVTAGPVQAPRIGGSIGGAGAPRTGGAMQPPKYTLAGAMVGRRGR